jgi:hypothetical protein
MIEKFPQAVWEGGKKKGAILMDAPFNLNKPMKTKPENIISRPFSRDACPWWLLGEL